jgi:hypothetical protein
MAHTKGQGICATKSNIMWSDRNRNKVWLHYVKNIIAADVYSAVFLASYLRYSEISKNYLQAIEVIDLQRYKILRKQSKVSDALENRAETPFVFFVGKN